MYQVDPPFGPFYCDCGKPIVPYSRVKEGLQTCIGCAEKRGVKKIGFMVFPHKTGSSLMTIDPGNEEAMRLAKRAHRRAR